MEAGSLTPDGPASREGARPVLAAGACAALLAAFAALAASAVLTKSPTYDESMHALAAWTHLRLGDFRADFEDPPLWGYWAVLPSARGAIRVDLGDPGWSDMARRRYPDAFYLFTDATLYRTPGNDGAAFVNRARLMMLALGVTLGVVLAAWSWQLAGPVAAVAATALLALDPSLLGHAPLVKNDVAMALLLCAAGLLAWRAGRRLTVTNGLGLALVVGAALVTKFTAVLLGPLLVLLMAVRVALPAPWPVGRRQLDRRRQRLVAALLLLAGIGVVGYAAIWAAYGFRFDPSPDPAARINTQQHRLDAAANQFLARHPEPRWTAPDPAVGLQSYASAHAAQVGALAEALRGLRAALAQTPELRGTGRQAHEAFLERAAAEQRAAGETRAAVQGVLGGPALAPPAGPAPPAPCALCAALHEQRVRMAGLEHRARLETARLRAFRTAPTRFVAAMDALLQARVLPSAWIHGLLFVHARSLYRGTFLLGRAERTGRWYYFPLAMLFKTPEATLLALLGSLAVGLWLLVTGWPRWAESLAWLLACVLVPVLVYMSAAMASSLNIGLRHVLPVYPFLYLAAGVTVAAALRRWPRAVLVAVAVLGVALAAGTLRAWPDYIAYFNASSGGARGGSRLLGDSNLDWGQDLPLLARWQRAHPDVPLAFGPWAGGSYFGTVDPAFYGIRATPLPPGPPPPALAATHVLAVSVTLVQGVLDDGYASYRMLEPREVLGGTIRLYDLRPGPR